MEPTFGSAAVLDLLLNRENPRHTHKESQPDVISYLVGDEEVANLARHMGKHGINPLEIIAVFPSKSGELVVAEGNRRVCAAQLLTDPEKAPEGQRARFRALSDGKLHDVSRVNIAQFSDYERLSPGSRFYTMENKTELDASDGDRNRKLELVLGKAQTPLQLPSPT